MEEQSAVVAMVEVEELVSRKGFLRCCAGRQPAVVDSVVHWLEVCLR